MTHALFTPVLISGPDARTLLQGQLSCDINALGQRKLLACINSPQGRVQAVLNVFQHETNIVLLVVSEMAEQTVERLRKYILRAKAKVELGDAALASSGEESATLLSQIRAGVPHVFPATHEAFVAQMLNLDVLGAISFDKGCYTGQEIIARAHYRGAVKRRMFRFAAECIPPPAGTRLIAGNCEHAGDVVYGASAETGCEMLAVVNLAQAELEL